MYKKSGSYYVEWQTFKETVYIKHFPYIFDSSQSYLSLQENKL